MALTVGSLFSGIGGIDLGLERAGMVTRWFVEIDSHCRNVLARHWPGLPIYGDITAIDWSGVEPVDVLAGGFPCQPVSFAGYGRVHEDERWLWPEFERAIRTLRPRYVLIENVAALLERGARDVLRSLAGMGFDAEWSIVSACSLGATHMRQRLFIVAHADGLDGWSGLRDTPAWPFRPLQEVHDFSRRRAGYLARVANPSALYRGADGVPDRPQRNRAIGNAVVPDVAEWIGRRIIEAEGGLAA
jgi:DNA (cytosine-5)-methyltransferase 1